MEIVLTVPFTATQIKSTLNIPQKEIDKILKEFEEHGLLFKTWDVKKQDYVYHKTEFGYKVAEKYFHDK